MKLGYYEPKKLHPVEQNVDKKMVIYKRYDVKGLRWFFAEIPINAQPGDECVNGSAHYFVSQDNKEPIPPTFWGTYGNGTKTPPSVTIVNA